MNSMTASLRLTFPPISNQEADWFLASPEARKFLDQSRIYMIGQREEILIKDQRGDLDTDIFSFTLSMSGQSIPGTIDLKYFSELSSNEAELIGVEGGEKIIRIFEESKGVRTDLQWYTADKLLFDHSHGAKFISFPNRPIPLSTFDLLYIGMSQGSAFKRLIEEPHHKRVKILTNEMHIRNNARLSDEMVLFFFYIDPLHITQSGPEEESIENLVDAIVNPGRRAPMERLVADVEMAFIKMLRTKYNEVLYANYPKSVAGLYGAGIDRYAYVIAEDISFRIGDLEIMGGHQEGLPSSNAADFIFVEGENVKLIDASTQKEKLVTNKI